MWNLAAKAKMLASQDFANLHISNAKNIPSGEIKIFVNTFFK